MVFNANMSPLGVEILEVTVTEDLGDGLRRRDGEVKAEGFKGTTPDIQIYHDLSIYIYIYIL